MADGPAFELMPARSRSQASRPTNMTPDGAEAEEEYAVDPQLHQRTLWKLDCLLLPFLALLFLFNALDKANVCICTRAHQAYLLTWDAVDRECRVCALHS